MVFAPSDVVAIVPKICEWFRPAFDAYSLEEGLKDEFLIVFQTRPAFNQYKDFLREEILRLALPEDMKQKYDYTTFLLENGGMEPKWRKFREGLRKKVNDLLNRLEKSMFGGRLSDSFESEADEVDTIAQSKKEVATSAPALREEPPAKEVECNANCDANATIATIATTTTIETRSTRSSARAAVEDEGEESVDEMDEDEGDEMDEDEEDEEGENDLSSIEEESLEEEGFIFLKLKSDSKIIVIGDQAKFDELCEMGFTGVKFKDVEAYNKDEEGEGGESKHDLIVYRNY